jgi:3',5'-cyclic AMP phosphodiesterase CpdA
VQDVPEGMEETVYYIDYQGTRIISLDSTLDHKAQVPWLRRVLEDNPNRWTILTFHHPVFSPAKDRDNARLRAVWKPIFDEFRVDLVLNGHDHTYARTGEIVGGPGVRNVPTGYQQAYDPEIGTVYVVSVSGPKMYDITKGQFARRFAEDTQLYQVIEVNDWELNFRAYTATGQLYDAFTLEKREGKPNRLREVLPPENRSSADD